MRKAASQVELQRCNPNRTADWTCDCVSERTEGTNTLRLTLSLRRWSRTDGSSICIFSEPVCWESWYLVRSLVSLFRDTVPVTSVPLPLWLGESWSFLQRCDWPVSYLVILSGGFWRSVSGEQLLWCQWRPSGLWGELFVHPEPRLWALYLWRRRRRQHWQVGVPEGENKSLEELEL